MYAHDKLERNFKLKISKKSKYERLYIRVSKEEKNEIFQFKEKQGIGLLELVRIGIETTKKENCM